MSTDPDIDDEERDDNRRVPLPTYEDPRHIQFVEECEDVFLEVVHYNGYAGRKSPAVRCDNHDEMVRVIRATTMGVAWDSLGTGCIVYPK